MAKTKKRKYSTRRNGNNGRLSVAMVAGLIPGITWSLQPATAGNWPHTMERFIAAYTGYYIPEKRFRLDLLAYGMMPLILGMFVHGLANRFGINGSLRRMLPLPFEL